MICYSRNIFTILLFCFVSSELFSWGNEAHRIINLQTIRNLPISLQKFRDEDFYFYDHAGDADRRKIRSEDEIPRHYIELEHYPEFFRKEMPTTLRALQEKFGKTIVDARGTLPYVILELTDSLTLALKRKDWELSKKISADLGHYTADIFMPLNTTTNYDGQLTRNTGIKWRYEMELINRYGNQITINRIEPKKIDNIPNVLFSALGFSYSRLPIILRADTLARKQANGQYNGAYYSALWKQTSKVTNELFQDASNLYANLLFTAWQNAGASKIQWQTIKSDELITAEPEYLEQNFPNPFNSHTVIKYRIPSDSYVRLGIFNIFGQEVHTFFEGRQGEGRYEFAYDAEKLSGGIYFIRLQMNNKTEVRKMILQK